MAPNVPYQVTAFRETPTPRTSVPGVLPSARALPHSAPVRAGEHLAGALLVGVLLIWGSWLLWELARAVETPPPW